MVAVIVSVVVIVGAIGGLVVVVGLVRVLAVVLAIPAARMVVGGTYLHCLPILFGPGTSRDAPVSSTL